MTKEQIKEKLQTDDRWVIRAVLAIYARQTADEQQSDITVEHNKVGFNAIDAEIMSSFAKQIQQWENDKRFPQPLSKRQMELARKRIVKYAGQLAKIAKEKTVTV